MESTNIPDGAQKSQPSNIIALDDHQKSVIRASLVAEAKKLLGIPYDFGAEWTDYSKPPLALDCSEMVEGVFKIVGLRMDDGAQNQFKTTMAADKPLPGDLAFMGKGKDIGQIYHVGLVFDDTFIIEARGYQPESSFQTGLVILRPRGAWETYKNFVGYRTHPKLA